MFGVQKIGRYEVLNHLASGGMGQVFLARATGLGGFERQVVVKTLDLSVSDDEDAFVTMFLDEARLVGALHHQYIAPVFEVGCDEEGRYFLVMDYVHGETAEAVLRVSGDRLFRLPLSFSLTVVSCVASALDYAHNLCSAEGTPLEIVHRDVSLSNVMCGHDGAVKLIDFGIAKASNRATKTLAGTLKGKIGYLAPEQVHRKNVDHRADIFALGIVLYELTTGVRAFCEPSDLATLERILRGDVRRPSQVVDDYPPELERIVMRALQLDPAHRFQDAEAMGRELEAYASRNSIPLGHAAIVDVMSRLFAEPRARRRFARGSNDAKAGAVNALVEEGTPINDLVGDTSTRTVTVDERIPLASSSSMRAQRETIPEPLRSRRAISPAKPVRAIGSTGMATLPRPGMSDTEPAADSVHTANTAPLQRAIVPLEDRPTPIADPAHLVREQHARIPLEDRPTPVAESAEPMVSTDSITALPLPAIPAVNNLRKNATGPQLPLDDPEPSPSFEPDDDAPTVIAAESPVRGDPSTDIKAPPPAPKPIRATSPTPSNLAYPPSPIHLAPERNLGSGTSMVYHQTPETRTWLTLCGLFVVAVIAACIVAML
jgi:eukaryotic-like serine/threonine-protein kinase